MSEATFICRKPSDVIKFREFKANKRYDNIQKLIDHLSFLHNPKSDNVKIGFNMRHVYGTGKFDRSPHGRHWNACIAGHAGLINYRQEFGTDPFTARPSNIQLMDLASKKLGLSERQEVALFFCRDPREDRFIECWDTFHEKIRSIMDSITPSQAIETLRKYMKKDVIDWRHVRGLESVYV